MGFVVAGIAVLAYLLLGVRREERHITVGWKNSVEESVLAEVLIQRIERGVGKGVVLRHPPLGTTQAAHEVLVVNEIDLCPEYAGSALTGVLRLPPTNDATAIREQVKENYRAQFQIEWIGPLGFDAAAALAARKDYASKNGVKTLSELAASPARCLLAVGKDFEQRANGLTMLMRSERGAHPWLGIEDAGFVVHAARGRSRRRRPGAGQKRGLPSARARHHRDLKLAERSLAADPDGLDLARLLDIQSESRTLRMPKPPSTDLAVSGRASSAI